MIQGGGGEAKWFCRRKQNDFAFGPFDMKMVFDKKKKTKKTKNKTIFRFFFRVLNKKRLFSSKTKNDFVFSFFFLNFFPCTTALKQTSQWRRSGRVTRECDGVNRTPIRTYYFGRNI
jgi:hypothetical protein